LDYEKTYYRVNWHFLEEMLISRGFGPKWRSWIMKLVKGGSIAIRLNDENSSYFKPGKGLRQPPPPLVFNVVVDIFSRMLSKVVHRGYISGIMTDIYPEGVINLQYTDETLLFLSHDYDAPNHLKWLLVCFELISRMKINYHKSDLTPINLNEEANSHARIFCYKIGSFPFKYLEIPLHHSKLRREGIQPIVDKVINIIFGWKGRLLSYGARLTLLKACLASIPVYLMYVIKFPKWAIEAINSQMTNFFWNDQENTHKYHLSNFPSLSHKKELGGMGIPDLRDLNLCLLASWVQMYHDAESKLWKGIIDCRYHTCFPNIFCCNDRNSSPFWKWVIVASHP
jgi:hypothetical protein